jgi:hypothetical protein
LPNANVISLTAWLSGVKQRRRDLSLRKCMVMHGLWHLTFSIGWQRLPLMHWKDGHSAVNKVEKAGVFFKMWTCKVVYCLPFEVRKCMWVNHYPTAIFHFPTDDKCDCVKVGPLPLDLLFLSGIVWTINRPINRSTFCSNNELFTSQIYFVKCQIFVRKVKNCEITCSSMCTMFIPWGTVRYKCYKWQKTHKKVQFWKRKYAQKAPSY